MITSWTSRRLAAGCACALALLFAACGGSSDQPTAAPASSTPATTPPPAPATTSGPTSTLTGLPATGKHPTIFVKIDNTAPARPQAGLDAADVVYLEQVEAGLTRLAAVFSSSVPASIGPVRSARITDLELMRQYGRVAFAYSGANRKFLPSIAAAPLVNLSADRIASIYHREGGRRAPYNLFANGGALSSAAKNADPPHDVGFRFGAALPGGKPATSVTVPYLAARVSFRWSPSGHRWLWSMNGRPSLTPTGAGLGGATVVVQYVTLASSPYVDVNGSPTPYSRTVGSGSALILRDGKAWSGTWSRPTAKAGTTYKIAGQRATFAPGQVWVLLVPKGRTASVS